MAELEYSDVFAVFVTPTQGLKALVNPKLVEIAEALGDAEMTTAELSEKLETSRSTVRSGLNRLCEMGIVTMRKSTDDARQTIFTLCSVEVVSCSEPDNLARGRIDELIRSSRGSKVMPIYESILMTMAEMKSYGVRISRIMLEVGVAVGLSMHKRYPEITDDALSKFVKDFLDTGSDIRIDHRHDGIRVRARGGNIAAVLLMRELLMGFVLSVLSTRDGGIPSVNYSMELDADGNGVTFESRRYAESVQVPAPDYCSRDNGFYRIDDPFMVLHMGHESHYMITNTSMMAVIGALSGGCIAPMEISCATGIPHITVHSVLAKLEQIRMVEKDITTKGVVYRFCGHILIRAASTPADAPPALDMDNLGPLEFRGFVYRYMLWVAESFGIGAGSFFGNVGAEVGRRLAAAHPGLGAQRFLERFCRNYQNDGADLKLISYIPVHIELAIEASRENFAEYIGLYVTSVLEGALEAITGDHYRVTVDVLPQKRVGRIPAPEHIPLRRDGADGGTK